jgi:2-polyprenyl-3-methyl-5-hydroxy-6-metoxy-1,4-benzoquinol methylase
MTALMPEPSTTPAALETGRAGRTGRRVSGEVAVRCPLCNADSYRVRFDATLSEPIDPQRHYTSTSKEFGRAGRIVECLNCGIVYMNPRPHHQNVQAAYGQVEDLRYLEEETGRVATFSESLDYVRAFVPGGRLLDVGCHVGTFLDLAERAGYEVSGVEPSRWAAQIASERVHGPVHVGAVEDAPVPPDSYDVVTLWDVIEHLPDPANDLRAIWSALRPGGVLALSTMDVDALFARLAGRRWPWYMQMHLVYFSRRTLGEMLRREGFEIADVRTHRRVVRVSYLVSRLEPYSRHAHRLAAGLARGTRLADRKVGVNLGDIVQVVARKPLT